MRKLTRVRCFVWRSAGKAAMILAVPFWIIDVGASWCAERVSTLCGWAVSPNVLFYDFCVKRHNAIHEAGRTALNGGNDE